MQDFERWFQSAQRHVVNFNRFAVQRFTQRFINIQRAIQQCIGLPHFRIRGKRSADATTERCITAFAHRCCGFWICDIALADDARTRHSILPLAAGTAFASSFQCIPIGFGLPGAFCNFDTVLMQHGALEIMDIVDRFVVFSQRSIVIDLGLGTTQLALQYDVYRNSAPLILSQTGLYFLFSRLPSLGIGDDQLVVRDHLGGCIAQ